MNGKIESSRLYYLTKFILINKHPNYNPSKRNPNQMSEKQMIGQIGEMLSKTFGKENMIVLHPFPRNKEIPTWFDTDPRAYYFKQIKNGLYVRMAILSKILE